MSTPTRNAGALPGLNTVKGAMRLVRQVAAARSSMVAEEQLDELITRASDGLSEASFSAVQTLRDFGTINRAEAAFLFHVLFDLHRARFGGSGPAAEAAFYRARGEEGFARLAEADMLTHASLCVEGRRSLITDKGEFGERVATFMESPEPHADIRALGGLADDEAARIVDASLRVTFHRACMADAECARLRRAIAAVKQAHGLNSEDTFAAGQEPFELRVLGARLDQRTNAIMAFWLRRSGEHQLANLLIERPDEYERLVGGGSFRWRRCA